MIRLGLAAAVLFVSLGMTSGTSRAATGADQGSERRGDAPVGTWSSEVVVDGTAFPTATMSLSRDGQLCIKTPVSEATGEWHHDGHNVVAWSGKEVYQPGPGLPGYVLISQRMVLDGDTFSSQGESQVYDQEGNFWKTVHTTVTGTRTSRDPEAGCA